MIFMALAFAAFGIVLAVLGIKSNNILVTVFGIFFILGAVFLVFQFFKERKLRKLYEEDPEAYNAMIESEEEENPEAQAYEREMEELEEYDADSGMGYCPHCGNYGVNADKICEACGEKVTE